MSQGQGAIQALRDSKGQTLIEALVAVAILGAIAMGTASFINYQSTLKLRDPQICRLYVDGILANIRARGMSSRIQTFSPVGSTRSVPSTDPTNYPTITGVPIAQRWLNTMTIMDTSTPPQVKNAYQIQGAINALLAIYNSSTDYCNSAQTYSGALVPATVPTSADWTGTPDTRIRVQAFRTDTGVLECPGKPFLISPAGSSVDISTADGTLPVPVSPAVVGPPAIPARNMLANTVTGMSTTHGLLITVQTTYTNREGVTGNCYASQRFQYDRDTVASAAPNYFSVLSNNTSIPGRANCNAALVGNVGNVSLELGYNAAANIEAGSVMVCRDVSKRWTATQGTYGCRNAGGGTGQNPPNDTAYARDHYNTPGSPNTSMPPAGRPNPTQLLGSANWVPCDRVTACGVNPSSATLTSAANSTQPVYRLQYTGLPTDCRIEIETAAIDTAMNASAIAATPTGSFNFEIVRPSCNYSAGLCRPCWPVGSTVTAFPPNYPNGYYHCSKTAGACCPSSYGGT